MKKKRVYGYHSYESRVGIDHLGNEINTDAPLMGIEIEVEVDYDKALESELLIFDTDEDEGVTNVESVNDTADNDTFVLSYDGSLSSGFEIVSHAMPFNEVDLWLDNNEYLRELVRVGYNDTDTNGVHIHISKIAHHPLNIGLRMAIIINRMATQTKRILKRDSEYAEFIHISRDGYEQIKEGFLGSDVVEWLNVLNNSGAKYSALNLGRSHTYELRFFKGTNDIERIKQYVAMAKQIYEIACNPDYTTLDLVFSLYSLSEDLVITMIENENYTANKEHMISELETVLEYATEYRDLGYHFTQRKENIISVIENSRLGDSIRYGRGENKVVLTYKGSVIYDSTSPRTNPVLTFGTEKFGELIKLQNPVRNYTMRGTLAEIANRNDFNAFSMFRLIGNNLDITGAEILEHLGSLNVMINNTSEVKNDNCEFATNLVSVTMSTSNCDYSSDTLMTFEDLANLLELY